MFRRVARQSARWHRHATPRPRTSFALSVLSAALGLFVSGATVVTARGACCRLPPASAQGPGSRRKLRLVGSELLHQTPRLVAADRMLARDAPDVRRARLRSGGRFRNGWLDHFDLQRARVRQSCSARRGSLRSKSTSRTSGQHRARDGLVPSNYRNFSRHEMRVRATRACGFAPTAMRRAGMRRGWSKRDEAVRRVDRGS